eukprot:983587-Rhodomonas_salina.1
MQVAACALASSTAGVCHKVIAKSGAQRQQAVTKCVDDGESFSYQMGKISVFKDKVSGVAVLVTLDVIKSLIEECASVPCCPPHSSSGLVFYVGSVVVGCNGSCGAVRVCGVGGAVGGIGIGDVVVEVLLVGVESHSWHPHYHFTLHLLLNLPPLSSPLLL